MIALLGELTKLFLEVAVDVFVAVVEVGAKILMALFKLK